MNRIYRDRTEAGQLLAERLSEFANRDDVLVLGLPRGGVPVAYEVARRLHAPLDVFVVRKLGMPGTPELAMGAIATGGVRVLNTEVVRTYQISEGQIRAVAVRERLELERRELAYRGHSHPPVVRGKTVLLIDDGIATGSTVKAAVRALQIQLPERLVVAVPVAPATCYSYLRDDVDELVILMVPENFYAVGQWYGDFSQTTDEDVTRLLASASGKPPLEQA